MTPACTETEHGCPPPALDEAVLGIDIGGTKLAAGVVSSVGDVLEYRRMATPQSQDAEALFATIVELGAGARDASGRSVAAVGVGCGGPMYYPEGIVSPLHIPGWRDFPLRERLSDIFHVPVSVDNDAKAFALGEARFGAGRGSRSVLGMVVSTGVGGGIVTGGHLIHGASGNAGHIGHAVISERGPSCDCGARGCLTAYASGTGLARRARAALRHGAGSLLVEIPPREITGQAIASAARQGDPLAIRLLGDASTALARAILDAGYLLDLECVVLGGGLITGAGDILLPPLLDWVHRRARLPFLQTVDIRAAALGERSGVIGAAALASSPAQP